MQRREFHIWEFPQYIRIKLNDTTHNHFFEACRKRFRSLKACAKYLNIPYGRFLAWKRLHLFIPLSAIRALHNEIPLTWVKIEQNTIAYKGRNNGNAITNPILPLKESPELFGIITHLICDGCVNKIGNPSYINSKRELLNNFKSLINRSFGSVPGKEYGRSNAIFYNFSKTVVEIIQQFYNIKFKSDQAALPNELFSLSEDYVTEVIRAIVDDEGTVRENRIIVAMKNKTIIFQLKQLLVNLFGSKSISKIIVRDDYWSICVNARGLRTFSSKINLKHPEKLGRLKYAINRKKGNGKGRPVGETKNLILENLRNSEATPFDLYKQIDVVCTNINTHLKHLRQQGLVENRRFGYGFIWRLTDKGRATESF